MPNHDPNTVMLDRTLINDLLMFSSLEVRRLRRERYWGLTVKVLVFVGFLSLAYVLGDSKAGMGKGDKTRAHVAYVELYGPMMSGQPADADRLIPALQAAFSNAFAKTIVIRINSPGGSPVHAGRMVNEIYVLRKKYPEKPFYAVIEDLGSSAAYYVASAADQIYVDKASMVGSIGVVTSSFGYTEAMEKVGVERRLITAGANKSFLDPYSPLDLKIKGYWTQMLEEIHTQFIDSVTVGRGDRLNVDTPELFSGLIWTGAKSIEIGLADQLGSLLSVSRDTIGDANAVDYTPPSPLLQHLALQSRAQLQAWLIETGIPTLF